MTDFLISTETLEGCLHDDNLRIFDCTTFLKQSPDGRVLMESGKSTYDENHIVGAALTDIQRDFSDQNSPLPFTLPTEDDFAEAAASHGITNDNHLVFYSTGDLIWATRLWWVFRAFGHERVSVLDGGLAKWIREDRPLEESASSYAPTSYSANRDLSYIADTERVLSAIDEDDTCILNALSREEFRGESARYGRPGRIKGSESMPWNELIDPQTGCFLPREDLQNVLDKTSALTSTYVIAHCGAGIAATATLFVLALLGQETKTALYDNGMLEWAKAAELPMQSV